MMDFSNGTHGLWGPVTATLDWCETNYQFSYYIAELANTISNIATIGLALLGVRNVLTESLPSTFLIGFTGVALVGIGSSAFHATLLYEAQLADELPMIYVSSYNCFALMDTSPGFTLTASRGVPLFIGFVALDVVFTWSYYMYRNPIYHQIVFASLMLTIAIRTVYLLRYSSASARIPPETRSLIARIFGLGSTTFIFGFFIWNLDNAFCPKLISWKHAVGWPAAFLLEGHAWWHVLTAIGTYLMVVGNTYLSLCVKDDHRNYAISYMLGLPFVRRAVPLTHKPKHQ